jgi:predicted site-specific integrase-resolvase
MTGGMFDHCEKSAARILGVSTKTLAGYRKSGLIAHYRLPGGRVRYSTEQLAEFVASTRVASANFLKFPRSSGQR